MIRKIVYEFDSVDEFKVFESNEKVAEVPKEAQPQLPMETTISTTTAPLPEKPIEIYKPGIFHWNAEQDKIVKENKPKVAKKKLSELGVKRSMDSIYVRRKVLGIRMFSRKKKSSPVAKKNENYSPQAKRMVWVNNRARELCKKDERLSWETARTRAIEEWQSPVEQPQQKVPPKLKFPDFPYLAESSILKVKELSAHCIYGTPITFASVSAYLDLDEPLRWTPQIWNTFKADFLANSMNIVMFFGTQGRFSVVDDKIIYLRS